MARRSYDWKQLTQFNTVLEFLSILVYKSTSGEKQPQGGKATITMSGPANSWFGAGFNASAMADSPYTLVVNQDGVT